MSGVHQVAALFPNGVPETNLYPAYLGDEEWALVRDYVNGPAMTPYQFARRRRMTTAAVRAILAKPIIAAAGFSPQAMGEAR